MIQVKEQVSDEVVVSTLFFTLIVIILSFLLNKFINFLFKKFRNYFDKFRLYLSIKLYFLGKNERKDLEFSDIKRFKLSFLNKKEKKDLKFSDIKNRSIHLKKEGEIPWKNLQTLFTVQDKRESYALLKKYELLDNFEFSSSTSRLTDIIKQKVYIDILQIFHDVIQDIWDNPKIKKEQNTLAEQRLLVAEMIYSIKFFYHKTSIQIVNNIFYHIASYFIIACILILIGFFGKFMGFVPVVFVDFEDVSKFFLGLIIFVLVFPIGYFYYHCSKWKDLDVYPETKHDELFVLFKNIVYYLSVFVVMSMTLVLALYILANSGLEYNHAFHFLSVLILPTMEIEDINMFYSFLGEDIIFGMVSIKIFVLLFIFSLGLLFIQHLMEFYTEVHEKSNRRAYAIPPEFAKFFSYLILSIVTLILLYGTLFINYPNLDSEYKTCQSYIEPNYKTLNNCYKVSEETLVKLPDVQHYCNMIQKGESVNLSDCFIGLSIESDENQIPSNMYISSPARTLSDYLPLSIFLTLFGVIMMIATRNLLENYFIGLSLKINPPYQEGERIRIDGGEMLAVKSVGFRAATFYGISSHAELVIPHQKLVGTVITNYTQPTLDYREKITIYIPDNNHDRSIPREAEKVLLLAAFIATGVKKPKLYNKSIFSEFSTKFKEFENKLKQINSLNTKKEKDDKLEGIEKDFEKVYEDVWGKLDKEQKDKEKGINKQKSSIDTLFLKEIIGLVGEENDDIVKRIKKIITAIVMVVYDYEECINDKLYYSLDEYFIKRKVDIFLPYLNSDEKKEELEKIVDYLVKINYYYFILAKHLWLLKSKDTMISEQQKNKIDQVSLSLLDVPRVTSKHKKDDENLYWEVSLLVTVELAEQSDEIVQHINMFVDQLWNLFKLPYKSDSKNTKHG